VSALLAAIVGSAVLAAPDADLRHDLAQIHPPVEEPPLCVFPHHDHRRQVEGDPLALLAVGEIEPNNSIADAQLLPLGDGPGEDNEIDVSASITAADQIDVFAVELEEGDVLGLAAVSPGGFDSLMALGDPNAVAIKENDINNGLAGVLPPTSPLPFAVFQFDSNLTFVAPVAGTYFVQIIPFASGDTGSYTLQVRRARPNTETLMPAAEQIIFVDFDGATINAPALFGGGNNPANLSPLSTFLSNWGLGAGDLDAVIDATLATIEARLNETSSLSPNFSFELRNSRDDPDPFGNPNVSRLIIGGSQFQLGIGTIGIAEFIDPGNFGTEDTAVILLDTLSSAAGNAASVNSYGLGAGFTKAQAVGRAVGNIAAHEAGHYSGCFHTDPANGVFNIMDSGGTLISLQRSLFGLGADLIFGTADDDVTGFMRDNYFANEGYRGFEETDVRTSWAYQFVTAAPCPWDIDGDGDVGASDLSLLLGAWGTNFPPADFDGDLIVGSGDLAALLGAWGPCP